MMPSSKRGEGFLHRMAAGPKLAALAVLALGLSLLPLTPVVALGVLLCACALFLCAGFGLRALTAALWRLRWLVLVLGVALAVFTSIDLAIVNTSRVMSLILLAELVTASTSMSALRDVLHRVVRPLRRFGADPEAIALVLSLTITMIPVVGGFVDAVREAQQARGVRLGARMAVPLLVRTMRHADEVGEALAARGLGD